MPMSPAAPVVAPAAPEEKDPGVDPITGENPDGIENPEDPENPAAEPSGQDPADPQAPQGQEPPANGEEEPAPSLEDRFTALEAENKELRDRLEKPQEPAAPVQPQQPQQLTEEQYAGLEATSGLPRTGIDFAHNLVLRGLAESKKYVDQRMARFEKDAAIGSMAQKKEFADVRKYEKDMNEYLGRFSPTHHNNPIVLSDAYYYAKGKSSNKIIGNVRQSKVVSRTIAGKARMMPPSAPAGGGNAKGFSAFKLTAAEESAWESMGKQYYKSKEEYAQALPRFKTKPK